MQFWFWCSQFLIFVYSAVLYCPVLLSTHRCFEQTCACFTMFMYIKSCVPSAFTVFRERHAKAFTLIGGDEYCRYFEVSFLFVEIVLYFLYGLSPLICFLSTLSFESSPILSSSCEHPCPLCLMIRPKKRELCFSQTFYSKQYGMRLLWPLLRLHSWYHIIFFRSVNCFSSNELQWFDLMIWYPFSVPVMATRLHALLFLRTCSPYG